MTRRTTGPKLHRWSKGATVYVRAYTCKDGTPVPIHNRLHVATARYTIVSTFLHKGWPHYVVRDEEGTTYSVSQLLLSPAKFA